MIVVVPTMAAAAYFLLIAADRYEAEARFVVKSPSSGTASQISSLVAGTGGVVRSNEDAYIVHAYIASRDAVRRLTNDTDLVVRLSRPEADFLWTYPGPFRHPSEERLWRHFRSFVSIDFDPGTGITTLRVQAFRPEDAREIADALLVNAESLINSMGGRSQQETVRTAEREVEVSRERARQSLEQVTNFRRRTALIDPVRYSTAALETITSLAVEIARTDAELAELESSSPNSPQASALRRRIAAFDKQIAKERAALAGSDSSLAPLVAEYERLMLEREFAERTFASALTALEIARIDAERQRLYLERISTPTPADYPEHPHRLLNMIIVLAGSYMLFSIGRTLIGDTLAHAGK